MTTIGASLLQDARFAWRSFRRTPGAAVLAIATIAIGIGATAAIYSVIRSVLIAPLPYPRSAGLALAWRANPAIQGLVVNPSSEDLERWRRAKSLDGLTVYTSRSMTMVGGAEPEQVVASVVEPEIFDFLGVRPAIGRPFTRDEAASIGAAHVVLLGDALWHRRFGADAAVVGQTITLSDETYRIVGVMPAAFRMPIGAAALWIPAVREQSRRAVGTNALVRVRDGVSKETAEAELTALMAPADAHGMPGRWQARLMSPGALAGPTFRRALLVLLAGVGMVLLIGCANVGALVLARNLARTREIAVRLSLGATRGRLVRQLLTESLLIGLAGGVIGLAVGVLILRGLVAIRPPQLDELAHVTLSPQMFLLSAALAILTGVLFGFAPAMSGTRIALNDALKLASRGASTRQGTAARRALTVTEVALACVLLVGAGLLIRSYARMLATDPGFQPERRLAVAVALPETRYGTAAARHEFFRQLLEGVRGLPGIERAALGSGVPPSGGLVFGSLEIEGRPVDKSAPPPAFGGGFVSSEYFRTLGIPVRDGREFVDSDRAGSPPVAIINEAAARRFFPGERAVGKRLRLSSTAPWSTIVGVVGDLKGNAKTFGDVELYTPFESQDDGDGHVVVATTGDPAAMTAAIKSQVWRLDARLPVTHVTTLEAAMAETMSRPRFNLVLLASFAVVGLVLAAVGIYGVLAASVAQRTQEIGVRMALGALPRDIWRAIVREALLLAGIGLGCGVLLALAATRAMRAMLFETSAVDPAALFATVAVLGTTAIAASWLPARRAMRVDPMVALRNE